MTDDAGVTTFLFTDIEGSTRLWEEQSERMRPALANHDAAIREAVESNRGIVVKMTGDGVHAAFEDALDAITATLRIQHAMSDIESLHGVPLRVRCGLHAGINERRDNDFFGSSVNRAARIMSAAHGGQILVSQWVATLIRERLPDAVSLQALGTVRLRDLSSPETLYQLQDPRLRRDFPALRSLAATPNNLPQQLTSFIGREREVAEVKSLLKHARLLTLVGAGGLGKTRLSLHVAADILEDYPDGVWFVELAPITDARLVPQAIASVLGVKEEVGRPVFEALLKYLEDRRLLLILDNCEHLIQTCAELAQKLLRSGPHLVILASSREALNIPAEQVHFLPPLAVADPPQLLDTSQGVRSEAARLFIDRAIAARSSFRVTPGNAVVIANICHRLDGIPLAIELAAARIRVLSVENINERLVDRFSLLTHGDRTAMPRQQTLRALIDWSYDLLSERERRFFARLAVFANGWTLDAAESVAIGAPIDRTDVLDLLTQLVEKSLVVMDALGGRYFLLETIRQYAQQRLREFDATELTPDRHLEYYLTFAEQARPQLFGSEQGTWLARLDLERENLLAAHARCDHARDGAELGLRLVFAIKPYWLNRCLLGLGHSLTVEALARPAGSSLNAARCGGLAVAGQLSYVMGRYKEARTALEESLSIARALGDERRVAMTLQPLGMACLGEGDITAARANLEEALLLARAMGDKRELAAAMNALAQFYRTQGTLDAAEPLYEQVVTVARAIGDRESIAIGLLNLAMVSIGRAAGDRARSILPEVIEIAIAIGSIPASQCVLDVCASLATLSEDWFSAAKFYGAAQVLTSRTGLHRDPADESFLSPFVKRARTALGQQAFATAELSGNNLPYDQAMLEASFWLSRNPISGA